MNNTDTDKWLDIGSFVLIGLFTLLLLLMITTFLITELRGGFG